MDSILLLVAASPDHPSGGPLWVKSRPFSSLPKMSAFGGKADINYPSVKSPLIAKSGHWYAGEKSENFNERAMRALVRFRTTGRVCPECRLIDAIVLRPTHSEIKTRTSSRNPAPPCTLMDELARLRHHQPHRRTSHGESRLKRLRSTVVAHKPPPF